MATGIRGEGHGHGTQGEGTRGMGAQRGTPVFPGGRTEGRQMGAQRGLRWRGTQRSPPRNAPGPTGPLCGGGGWLWFTNVSGAGWARHRLVERLMLIVPRQRLGPPGRNFSRSANGRPTKGPAGRHGENHPFKKKSGGANTPSPRVWLSNRIGSSQKPNCVRHPPEAGFALAALAQRLPSRNLPGWPRANSSTCHCA